MTGFKCTAYLLHCIAGVGSKLIHFDADAINNATITTTTAVGVQIWTE